MLLNGCNRPWGRGGAVSWLLWCWAAPRWLPEDIRAAFRMAGLSHALAASGFHLSVLLGSVLMLARRWPPGLRLPLAATALLLFSLPCRSPAIGSAGGADGCDGLADS